MADKYPDFETLARNELPGVDYRIALRRAAARFAVIAPHGGGIEPGTSEVADAVAADEFSCYLFEGLKRSGNADLHITSTRFDEPLCVTLIDQSHTVITIHGEDSKTDGEPVFLGGLDDDLGCIVGAALRDSGFDVRKHPNPALQGREPGNLCNRGASGRGVQLELSRALRKQMFLSLSRDGRKQKTQKFFEFTDALRSVLGEQPEPRRAFICRK